ncbi:MAG: GTPase HflX [Hyphomicrobiaceae bacterium]
MRVVVLVPVSSQRRSRATEHAAGDRLEEAVGLACAIDLEVAESLIVPLAQPRPATLLGSGKVDEIGKLAAERGAGLVIVDRALSPIQQRNLEKAWKTKVIDRTGLILEIFGRRAATREGRLQVELAHLTYQKSRLVRSWTHLERQRGGAGFLGGPGESQLELDRRIIQDRIDALEKELAQVVRTRELHRKGRARVPYPVCALVGYTNAGKSTLFNALTGAGVHAMDQVFATLDPTMREIRLPSGRRVILSDTVGFISDLPTTLVAAFRATLEEVVTADLIVHVRDISHAETAAQRADVHAVLKDLGITPETAGGRVLEVWNKVDRLDAEKRQEIENMARRIEPPPILVSAVTGEGIAGLLSEFERRLGVADEVMDVTLPPGSGKLAHWLHENAEVLSRQMDDDGATHFRIRIDHSRKARLEARMRGAA